MKMNSGVTIESFSDVLTVFGGVIRGVISWPFRLIMLLSGFPNCKIVYKSGHAEYYFFKNIKIEKEGSKLTSLEWQVVGVKTPFHINVNEIESIVKLW